MLATSTTNDSGPNPSRSTAPSTNLPRVLHPAGGERREVGVLGERLLRRDQRRQLSQQAALAHPHVQRVGHLRPLDRLGGQKQLARRRGAEVQEAPQLRRPAEPAGQRPVGGGGGGVRRRLGQHLRLPPVESPAPAGLTVSTPRSVPRAADSSIRGCEPAGCPPRWTSARVRPGPHRTGGWCHDPFLVLISPDVTPAGKVAVVLIGGGDGHTSRPCRSTAGPTHMGPWQASPPWCNGSTSDFGSDGPGSNPGGGAGGRPTAPPPGAHNTVRSVPRAPRYGSPPAPTCAPR